MNVLYERAVLTIVAAAGADETYGLPGVSHMHEFLRIKLTACFGGLKSNIDDGTPSLLNSILTLGSRG